MRITVIGAGGKTTACLALARAFSRRSVLLTTTTHIYPVLPPQSRCLLTDPGEEELLQALSCPGVVCAGASGPEGKLAALPGGLLAGAMERAQLTLCEGDGSRHHPLKLHRPHEPVLLPGTDLCLVVAGLSALGRPVEEAVHCFELEPRWRAMPRSTVGAEELCLCVEETVRAAGIDRDRVRVILNQADCLAEPAVGEAICRHLAGRGLSCRTAQLRRAAPGDLIRELEISLGGRME